MTSTLDLILRQSNDAVAISLKKTAKFLDRSPKTIRNLLSLGKFQIEPTRVGGSVMFSVIDVAALIDSKSKAGQTKKVSQC